MKVKAWKITLYENANPLITEEKYLRERDITGDLVCMEVGQECTIKCVEVDQEELLGLPEWDGP